MSDYYPVIKTSIPSSSVASGRLLAAFLPLMPKLALLLWIAALLGCAPSSRDAGDSRIGVYSTAYLTDDNQIAYASNSGRKPASKPRPEWIWNGDGVLGKPSIEVNLATQSASFFKNGSEVGRSPISSGREGYGTPTGNFAILDKNQNHVSSLYGDYVDAQGTVVVANVASKRDARPPGTKFRGAPMPYFMRIHGGVGMHAGYLPGYPASHGCIRMPRGAAQRFFENAPVGTPVKVIR
jgi:lipoprotein-anchoring transpeptidase ErfK/SrfK